MARFALLLPLLLAACGGFETATTLTFSVDLGRVDGDPSGVLDRTVGIVTDRLERQDLSKFRVKGIGYDRFVVELPATPKPVVDEIVELVTAAGKLDFRVEVLPREVYAARYGSGRLPQRLEQAGSAPWPGTPDEFDALKQREVERWRQAREAGEPYEPSDARYRLVRRHGEEGTEVAQFHVLEQLAEGSPDFGGAILVDPVVSVDENSGVPVVLYHVREEYQAAFHTWTKANVGLPLAIVLDDEYRTAPTINSALRDSVQITLGRGSYQDVLHEAEALVSVLRTGALPVPPKLESVVHHEQ